MGVPAFLPPSLADPEPMDGRPAGTRGREAAALLLFAGAAFLLLSLASCRVHPHDPTFSGPNWMGDAGAVLARVLARGFGAAAWWVPVELLLLGAPLLAGRRPPLVGLRVAGDLLILVLVASLLQVAAAGTLVFGHLPVGGNVGLVFGELLRGLFSAPGSFLVGGTAILLILIGRSSFSLFEALDRAVLLARLLTVTLGDWIRTALAFWSRASALRALEESQQQAKPSPAPQPPVAPLQDLDFEDPWVPNETTGAPPLWVSDSLKAALKPGADWETESPSLLPPQQSWVEPRPPSEESLGERSQAGDLQVTDAGPPAACALEETPDGLVESLVDLVPTPPLECCAGAPTEQAEAPAEQAEASAEQAEAPAAQPTIVDTSSIQATRAAKRIPEKARAGGFRLPETHLLDAPVETGSSVDREVILHYADLLEKTLADYGVTGKVEEIHPGPTVTTYEVAPAAGTKVSKVAGLSDDLALGLSRKVRIIAPIPGKSRIGFEIPNDERCPVNLRELVEDERFLSLAKKAPLPVVLGRDIVGAPFYADLSSMPHVIVAGATGAGKSVGLNVMLSSLLFLRPPEDLRLLMIDPKVVELAPFDKIPHLLLPVVTDMNQASQALKWAVDEMERRYQLFAEAGTKNITTYNRYVQRVRAGDIAAPRRASVEAVDHNGDLIEVPVAKKGNDAELLPEKMPYIVIVVDEFADLMMQQGKEVEASVARLAQKARAAGMHVILATQRPSVDVITGMIKANFPSRIAFRVAQKVDSRTILDEQGAEVLLGKGDKLVKLNGATETRRVQCPFISEEEVNALCEHLRGEGEPHYDEQILASADEEAPDAEEEKVDARFEEAVMIVRDGQRCSTSWLQRKMTIGYNRAAKMVDMMERRGYVGPPNGSKDREVLLMP